MTRIVALHGFLGLPNDWQKLKTAIQKSVKECEFQSINLYESEMIGAESLEEWAKTFNENQKDKHVERNILVGYSLGGRLALHAALDKPGLWDEIVLISAHPGLTDFGEIHSRMMSDIDWSAKFREMSWNELIHSWNDQPVFNGTTEPKRKEKDYNRDHLIHMIKDWSLAQHEVHEEALIPLKPKLRWYAGEKDQKYLNLFENLKAQGFIDELHVVKGAGHRIIFDNPEGLARQLVSDLNL